MQDVVWSFFWLLSTALTFHWCAEFAGRAWPLDSVWQRLLHTAVLAISACIIGLTLLGALGLLWRPLVLLAPVLLSGATLRWLPVATTIHNQAEREPSIAAWLWTTVAALILGHSIVNGVICFPEDFDCLMYHLPLIDIWIQTGSLAATESPRWSDSANSELLRLWFCRPLSGDFLAPLNKLPVMIVWVAGLLELTRQFRVSGWWRHVIALASIAVYTTVHETDDASNDLMVVAFFVSGVVYALRYQRSGAAADRLLFGLSLGVLAGTKFFATEYALLLGLMFFWLVCSSYGWRKAVQSGVVSVGISLLAGGYWYLRNYAMIGHVFFPKGSPLMQERITHPDLAKTTLAFNGDVRVPDLLLDAVWRLCGPLHFAALQLLPTILVALIFLACRRGRNHTTQQDQTSRQHWLLLAGLLVSTAVIALCTPMLVEDQPGTLNHLRWGYTPIRYSLCFLTMLMLASGALLDRVGRRLPTRLSVVVGGCVLVAAACQLLVRFYSRTELNIDLAIAVGGMLFVVWHLMLEACRRSDIAKRVSAAVIIIGIPALIVALADHWHRGLPKHFAAFYSAESLPDELSLPGERILVLDERSYAFFGSARQHYVLHAANFRDMSQVRDLVRQHSISLIVTRIETTPQKISRYYPAWNELDAAKNFRTVGEGRELRFYRPGATE